MHDLDVERSELNALREERDEYKRKRSVVLRPPPHAPTPRAHCTRPPPTLRHQPYATYLTDLLPTHSSIR